MNSATVTMDASIFRSEEMRLCQLFLSSEASFSCVSELGEIGMVQFRDLNPDINPFQRKFVSEVRRCDEMERILNYLETQIKAADITVVDSGENPEAPLPREMVDLEATFEKLENELREVNGNANALDRNFLELTELKCVLESAQLFLDQDGDVTATLTQNLISPDETRNEPVQLGFVAGVIPREKLAMFERMLWRVSRGNAFLRQQDIPTELKDPVTGAMVRKTVYIIFFQGDQLKLKVKKICEGCRSTLYPCPDSATERSEMLKGVKTRLSDLSMVLSQTTDHRQRVLLAAAKHLRMWLIKARKIKAIYHTLNMFNVDVTNKCLIAEGWIPVADMLTIKEALRKGTEKCGSSVQPILNVVQTNFAPPTFHRTNKFTTGFQALIEAYGVATYREVNPGLYTCATFPFLFAVMFGDLGHGSIMFFFALWMVLREKPLAPVMAKSEITNMIFGGRYIVLMMGMFSMYTGFVYNDVFSKSMNIFGSSWHVGPNATDEILEHKKEIMLLPGLRTEYVGVPYPVGVDPVWQLAVNKIAFLNSYKMKISIIIGVVHMFFGVSLSIVNHMYFKRAVNVFCEFIPQVFFLLALFGWLCVMIFIKWLMYGEGDNFGIIHGSSCAPAVLILFINMMLGKSDEVKPTCESNYMFDGQQTVQTVLVLGALLCVPILLIPKPFILKRQAEAKKRNSPLQNVVVDSAQQRAAVTESTTSLVSDGGSSSDGDANPASPPPAVPSADTPAGGDGHGEEFEFSEVFIHQAIHTIEYVLGSVSHTASYLRLWALSLAHAQLSEVLWNMVMKIGLAQSSAVGAIMVYLIFAAWAFLTISILVVMEGLSAFLHTLRLHWVEFCSKFYEAQGYLFVPFTFKTILNPDPNE